MDSLTNQIVQQLSILPHGKKKALLELLKQNQQAATSHFETEHARWKEDLLSTLVWTEAEINAIQVMEPVEDGH